MKHVRGRALQLITSSPYESMIGCVCPNDKRFYIGKSEHRSL